MSHSSNRRQARYILTFSLSLACLVSASELYAQNVGTENRIPPTVEAVRIQDQAPSIDGTLDEPVWQLATPATGFLQERPTDGAEATERTFVRILYDREALYIGVRLADSEATDIVGRLIRRDALPSADAFWVTIDSYHDHRTSFQLGVNPSGAKWDGITSNDNGDPDISWDPVWSVATSVDSLGWIAEMKIPLSQLRFSDDAEQLWGINFSREIFRKSERLRWSWKPNTEPGYASWFGHLEGLRDLPTPRRLEVLPYVVTKSDYTEGADPANPFNDGSVYDVTGGMDLKYGVTSNLTVDATINPDFGQVEADPAVVNLTAFETFFEERRPFFVEGSNLFRFGAGSSGPIYGAPQLFYSRRVGRAPSRRARDPSGYVDNPISSRILGAAKLSGQTGGWSVGLLNAVTAQEFADIQRFDGSREKEAVEPLTNHSVLSLRKDLRGGASGIGIMGTGVNRRLSDPLLADLRSAAYSGGVDLFHRFGQNRFAVEATFSGSFIRGNQAAMMQAQRSSARYYQRPDQDYVSVDSTATSLTGYATSIQVGKISGNWIYGSDFYAYSPGFEINDAGFQTQTDQIFHGVRLGRRWLDPGKVFRNFNVNATWAQMWNFGGSPQLRQLFFGFGGQFLNYWSFGVNGNYNFRSQNDDATRGGPSMQSPSIGSANAFIASDGRKAVSGFLFGWYARNSEGGMGANLGTTLNIRPTGALTLSLAPSYMETRAKGFYVTRRADPSATATYGYRYIFNELVQRNFNTTVRLDAAVTPDLSIQLYAQPFIASADYQAFKELAAPSTFTFIRYGVDGGSTLEFDEVSNSITVDTDGSGPIDPIVFGNPDFRVRSLISNLVVRWEFSPGSTLFLVWNHGQSGYSPNPEFRIFDELGSIFGDNQQNTFVVKINYWISP